MTKKESEFGPGKEFFSEWHRDRYADDLERELEGVRNRLEIETTMTPEVREGWESTEKAIVADLKRLGRQAGASKRPAGADKETR
jgi:hypothetical protein